MSTWLTPRASLVAGAINGVLYAAGGENATGALATLESFTSGAAAITITKATPQSDVVNARVNRLRHEPRHDAAECHGLGAGQFSYSPAAGAVLGAGPQTLSVTFTPTDTTDYATATASVSLGVTRAPASVTPGGETKIMDGRPGIDGDADRLRGGGRGHHRAERHACGG